MAVSTVSFNERLSRIEKERVRTAGRVVLHVGAEEVTVRSLSELKPKERAERTVLAPLLMLVGLVVGVIAFALSTAIRMRMVHEINAQAVHGQGALVIGAGMAILLGIFGGAIFGLRGRAGWAGMFVGVLLGAVTLHNAAHYSPQPAATLFTPGWVDQERAVTTPGSLDLAGRTISLWS